jgi:hypothetical protein
MSILEGFSRFSLSESLSYEGDSYSSKKCGDKSVHFKIYTLTRLTRSKNLKVFCAFSGMQKTLLSRTLISIKQVLQNTNLSCDQLTS